MCYYTQPYLLIKSNLCEFVAIISFMTTWRPHFYVKFTIICAVLLLTVDNLFHHLQYVYAQPDQAAVVEGIFVPWCENCTSGAIEQGLGVVGAVIMPHNLYLHSGLVLVSAMHVKFLSCS